MPIPAFDTNLVLPPHLGNPTLPAQLSPYPCTALELCQQFATSPERRQILDGLLRFREMLRTAQFQGFQWLDGSFLEDIETRENRPPKDLDVATLYWEPNIKALATVVSAQPVLQDQPSIKAQFHLDHYFVDVAYNPLLTVESARYWIGLFSHRRDGVWKGMLRVELNTPAEDADAGEYLRRLP